MDVDMHGLLEIGETIVRSKALHHVEIVDYSLPGGKECQLIHDEETNQEILGISKKELVRSFLVARNGFFEKLLEWRRSDNLLSRDTVEFMNKCSVIILLVASEHNTVLNWRKERVLMKSDPAIVLNELDFIRVFLSSPLKKHSKSPLLWHHRQWVLDTAGGFQYVGKGFFETERDMILIAAENHPANYYAWNYCRWIINRLCLNDDWIDQFVEFCYAHPSDISAWTFLFFLFQSTSKDESGLRAFERFLPMIYTYATSPQQGGQGHDSVWTFLRLCAVSPDTPSKCRQQLLDGMSKDYPDMPMPLLNQPSHQEDATLNVDDLFGSQKQIRLVKSFYEFIHRSWQ